MEKDTLNIKKAVCCSEVTPEKGNQEEKENVNFTGVVNWKDYSIFCETT